jgi:hypothetical protein
MTFVLTLHSIVRWLTVLVAVAAIVKFAMGWLQKQPFDKTAKALVSAFGGMMDLQLLLGFIFFFWNGLSIEGGLTLRYRLEHLGVMLVAVVVAHLPAMWKKAEDNKRYRNTLIAIVVSLLLVVAGVAALPGNRWLTITGLF